MTLPAIIDTSKAVVCVDGEDSSDLNSEYQKLSRQYSKLTVELEEQIESYIEINKVLSSKFPAEVSDCNILQGEIAALQEDLYDLDDSEGDEDPLEFKDSEDADEKKEAPKSNKAMRNRAKYLFNRIAAMCHPDKTNSTNLVEIFYEAKAAKDAMDLERLETLHDLVTNSKSKSKHTRSKAKEQLALLVADLKDKIMIKSAEIHNHKNEGINPIFARYQENPTHGELAFEEVMKRTKARLLNAKKELVKRIALLREGKEMPDEDTDYSTHFDEAEVSNSYGYGYEGHPDLDNFGPEVEDSEDFEFEGYDDKLDPQTNTRPDDVPESKFSKLKNLFWR